MSTSHAPSSDRPESGGHIGKTIRIEGVITGHADLHVDGEVHGQIELGENSVTIGQNGHAKADVVAKNVAVQGRLEGKVKAADRIAIAKTGSLEGEVTTSRIAVEDGAIFRGSINLEKGGSPIQANGSGPNAKATGR
ncbi:MAG: polymer-forming cytoskeletal protein [Acidobacteriota bacterium]